MSATSRADRGGHSPVTIPMVALGPGREFDLIRTMLDVWGDLATNVGSDAAAITLPTGELLVTSTDSSIENVHFRRGWFDASQIGYRATAAALSDLAAAAARPVAVLIALGIPPQWVGEVADLAAGIGDAVHECGARIIGGDTSRASELSITVTVLGSALRPLTRAGARIGDRIFLTGDLGRSARALARLQLDETPDANDMERFARPSPRIEEALWLRAHGAVASIDVSDGLVSDLRHLSAASGVRIEIDAGKIPAAGGLEREAINAAITSGEEYELVIAAPSDLDVKGFNSAFSTPISEIGRVVDGTTGVELLLRGAVFTLPARGGHDHF